MVPVGKPLCRLASKERVEEVEEPVQLTRKKKRRWRKEKTEMKWKEVNDANRRLLGP